MDQSTLPYLSFLEEAVSGLRSTTIPIPLDIGLMGEVASRLLDNMIVQSTVATGFKQQFYADLLKLLPEVKARLAEGQSVKGTTAREDDVAAPVQELQGILARDDVCEFDRCLYLTSQLQKPLFSLATAEASTLCKAITQIEAHYSYRVTAAVDARRAAVVKQGPVAKNARKYDEQALLAFIRGRFPQESAAVIQKSGFISGGYSKYTVGITLSNVKGLPQDMILRGDTENSFDGMSVIAEYALLKSLYERGVSVAKPLALEDGGTVFGSPFMLVERRRGNVIGGGFKLPTKQNKALCVDAAEKLAAIHRVPLEAIGGQIDNATGRSSDKARAWIEDGYKTWQSLNMPSPVVEMAFVWLRHNIAVYDRAPRALVHADFGLQNLLIHEDKVDTILDWEFAHVGNPAYDLSYFRFAAKALYSWECFLEAYGNAGMPIPDQEQLDYTNLLASTRHGVMVCQGVARFASSSAPGAALAAVVAGNYYEESIRRVSDALNCVL